MSAETLTEEGSGPRTAYSLVRVHVRCCNWSAELCRNCVRSPRNRRQISTFTGSHREAFCGGKSLNRLREEVFQYHSVCVARTAFQACSIDHSDISPFRINDLQSRVDQDSADCDKSSNVPRSLTGFSSIAAPAKRPRRVNPAKLKGREPASKSAYTMVCKPVVGPSKALPRVRIPASPPAPRTTTTRRFFKQ